MFTHLIEQQNYKIKTIKRLLKKKSNESHNLNAITTVRTSQNKFHYALK